MTSRRADDLAQQIAHLQRKADELERRSSRQGHSHFAVDALNETSTPPFTATTFGILSNRGFSRSVKVTVETGTTAIVVVSCNFINSTGSGNTNLGYQVTGASSVLADFSKSVLTASTSAASATFIGFETGLTSGQNTFELQARTAATSGTIRHPSIAVIRLT